MLNRSGALAAAALLVLSGPLASQARQRFASLEEAQQAGAVLAGRGAPSGLTWIEGGARYSYTAREGGRAVIRAFDPASGRDTTLFSAEGLTLPGTSTPFTYQSFEWARDFRHLVFQTNVQPLYRRSGVADYYIYGLEDRRLTLAARGARTAQLSPDGTLLGLERGGDMYAVDLASGQERRLTEDATETTYNGHFDWVYEEEFGLAQAWNWSPDSRYLAYWQVDESSEPVVQLSDFSGRRNTWDRIRIPQPGDTNPRVRIGIVTPRTGARRWLDPGEPGEYYIPRIYWTSSPDTLAMLTLDRPQQTMKLWFFDVTTGGRRLVMTESSKTWIDVYDFYAGVSDLMAFPAGVREFFWVSDRDGWQHIYRYDYSGTLLGQVTRGAWSVTRIEGIDPKRRTIYYTSTDPSPLQRQLWSVRFQGGLPKRLTTERGTHAINLSPGTQYYVDTWSSVGTPRRIELWATGGKRLRVLEDNAATTRWLASHAYSAPELRSFTTSDSVRIDFSLIKPEPFDAGRKYPVIFAVYGGPGSQGVYDRFAANVQQQWYAQQGYVVVDVNNRGSNNYGRAFMKVVYGQLGKYESHDFAETARHLATLPYVDSKRVAIMGGSYGGYSTIYTMEMYPDLFGVGIANSAVADWSLYDTIYTERYMGLLGSNPEGYEKSSAVVNAPKLRGHLLLVHAMLDENVHPQNTMQLLTAFANARKDVDQRIYPPGHHGSAYNGASRALITAATVEYLARYLAPASPMP